MIRPLLFLTLAFAATAAERTPPAFPEGAYVRVEGDEDFCPARPTLSYEESAGTTALRLGARFVFTDVGADHPAAVTAGGCTQAYENQRGEHFFEQKITGACKDPTKSFVKRARLEWSEGALTYSLATEGKQTRVCKYKPKGGK